LWLVGAVVLRSCSLQLQAESKAEHTIVLDRQKVISVYSMAPPDMFLEEGGSRKPSISFILF